MVFPDTAMVGSPKSESEADKIICQYIQKLKDRREFKIGCKLVRTPQGNVDWKEDDGNNGNSIVLCRLNFSHYYQAKALPLDPTQPAVPIKGKEKLMGALSGDTVRVDTKKRCVLFDEKTENAST